MGTINLFIENTLAVKITVSFVKTQVAIFRDGFWINQHDKVFHKKQSPWFMTKKVISEWRRKRRIFFFILRNYF